MRDFAGIFDEHVNRVYGYFAYMLASRADAEDLTQLTFERAFRAWGRHDERLGSVSAWLSAIARNLLVDHLRATPRTPPAAEALLEDVAAPPDRYRLGLDPTLERALAGLDQRARELIALRIGGDLSGAEIAELTGLSLSNVQQILSRSLRRVRASLDGAPVGTAAR